MKNQGYGRGYPAPTGNNRENLERLTFWIINTVGAALFIGFVIGWLARLVAVA